MELAGQENHVYYVRLPNEHTFSGRQYIKNKMKEVGPNWPHDHIIINVVTWSTNLWRVEFKKKAAEHEVLFKMLLE